MRLALLAAAMTGVQVGAALVASEAIVADVGAGRLGFLRYAIALVFLLPFGLRAAGPPFRKSDLLPVALIGIGQFGVLVALLNIAVLYSSSARVVAGVCHAAHRNAGGRLGHGARGHHSPNLHRHCPVRDRGWRAGGRRRPVGRAGGIRP